MKEINDGGVAFPSDYISESDRGMSLRDYFASKSLNGIRAGKYKKEHPTLDSDPILWNSQDIAEQAYKDADAMLKAREN